MSNKLTLELIIKRVKNSKLDQIKALNLWGKDLEDISILSQLPNLEIVSLRKNKISNIEVFKNHINLRELYLKENLINDIKQIENLKDLNQFEILSLEDNPITSIPDYRNKILEILPQLKKLDDKTVESVSPKHKIIPIIKAKNSKEEKKFEISQRESINLDFNQLSNEKNNKTTIEENINLNINKYNDDKDNEEDDIVNLTTDNIKSNLNNLDGKVFILDKNKNNEIRKKVGTGAFQKKSNIDLEQKNNNNKELKIQNYKKPTVKKITKRIKGVQIPSRLTLSYSDADFKKFLNNNNNQYKKKKLGNFSKYGNSKNENIKDKNDRYDDDNTPSKNSEFQINNSPLNKINIDNLNLSEKNIVVQSIKMLLNIIDKENLQDIKNEIDKILLKK